MNWDQKALEAWLEESARRDEDALILEKYTRSDESKVKVILIVFYISCLKSFKLKTVVFWPTKLLL